MPASHFQSHPAHLLFLIVLSATLACAFPTFGGTQPPGPTPTATISSTPLPSETPIPTASPTSLPTVAATAATPQTTPTEIVVPDDFPAYPNLPIEPPAPATEVTILVTNNTNVLIIVNIGGQELFVDQGETLPLFLEPGFYEYNIVAEGFVIFASGADFPPGYWTWIVDGS